MNSTTHREKRFVAPLPLLPFTRAGALDYRVLSACNLIPVSASYLREITGHCRMRVVLARLLEQGYLLEHSAPREYLGYTLTRAGEAWIDRFYTEHHAALEVLARGKS